MKTGGGHLGQMGKILPILLAASFGWSTLVAAVPQVSITPIANPVVGSGAATIASPPPTSTPATTPITSTPPPPPPPPTTSATLLSGPAGLSVVISGTPVVAGLPAAIISGTTYSLAPSGTAIVINGTPTPIVPGPPPTGGPPPQSPIYTPSPTTSKIKTGKASPAASTATWGSSVVTHASHDTSAWGQHTPGTTATGKQTPHTWTTKVPPTPHSAGSGNSPSAASSAPSLPPTVAPGSFVKPISNSGAGLESPGVGMAMVVVGFFLMLVRS